MLTDIVSVFPQYLKSIVNTRTERDNRHCHHNLYGDAQGGKVATKNELFPIRTEKLDFYIKKPSCLCLPAQLERKGSKLGN